MMKQEVKCTPNNQCKCTVQMKNGVCYYVKCKIFLQMNMQSFLYKNLANILQADLMQVPCKMKNAIMHNDANIFVIFWIKMR